MVTTDRPESPVRLNSNLSRNPGKIPGNGHLPDSFPIVGTVSLEGPLAELELSAGDSGVFFPDVVGCRNRTGDLGMYGESKDARDSGQRTLLAESQDDLPVEIPAAPAFKLAPDPDDPRWGVWDKPMMGDGEQPIDSLSSCHVISV